MNKPSVCGSDVALRQITLTTCYISTVSDFCSVSLQHPERSYTLDVGVTSVAFSFCRPNLLAVITSLFLTLSASILENTT